MKSKELIRRLLEVDPSGEEEVCVGNVDIHFVESLPAYYDGTLQVLERDENCKFYNIIGGKYVRTGSKINIHTLSIQDAICNDHNFKVDYSALSPDRAEVSKKAHDSLREWCDNLDNEIEYENFLKWVKTEAAKVTEDTESIEGAAKRCFDKHVSPKDPLPEGGVPTGKSYVDVRYEQWSQKFEVIIDGFLTIRPKEISLKALRIDR